jgi:predicted Fe-Mo cluster-binding NifX family protein
MGMGAQTKFSQAGVKVYGYSGNVQKALNDFMDNSLDGLEACKDHIQSGHCP